jgi:hypothetical protein
VSSTAFIALWGTVSGTSYNVPVKKENKKLLSFIETII